MEKTTYYQLNKPEAADPLRVADFNENSDIIDAALGAAGNCKIACGTYTGVGKFGAANPTSLTFDFAPQIVFIWKDGITSTPVSSDSSYQRTGHWTPRFVILLNGAVKVICADSDVNQVTNILNFSGNTVSVYNDSSQMCQWNTADAIYHYMAIG